MKSTSRLLWLIPALALAPACASRTHLTEGHGRSVKAAFASQAANPTAGQNPKPLAGLDAQEASIVARSYRRSLATKAASSSDDRGGMLILAPNQAAQPYVPPPSVPERQ